ncbi:MAG: Nre family DNA repair protein [Candidatus Nezhaarchaeota archaeon]|nr:Nre family DNA repair protein [Candidatus Nezhaarchaeota archaeon]
MVKRFKKFVKVVKAKTPWLEHVIEEFEDACDLNQVDLVIRAPPGSLCVYCKGSKMLCGKAQCPILVKIYSIARVSSIISSLNIVGSSPPAIFIGRHGYPYVQAGPLVPPFTGDTSILDTPELWLEASIQDIVDFRVKLIHGRTRFHVKDANEPPRILSEVQLMAMGSKPVDSEMILLKKPSASILLDDEVQPMGPSAPIKGLKIGNVSSNKLIEKAISDTDLKARDAILELYEKGVPVSQIQRVLSAGLLGVKGMRKLVPTRWSITAVDSTISRVLRDEKVKEMPEIDEYRVYSLNFMDNSFVILMFPGKWSYESIEAWFPGTTWNPGGGSIAFCGDWEGYWGRTTYASMGGCYYAARLAVTEHLVKIGKQASVLVLRESHPGYIMPVGVWIVRECVRKALSQDYEKSDDLKEALRIAFSKLSISPSTWMQVSKLLNHYVKQERLTKFINQGLKTTSSNFSEA